MLIVTKHWPVLQVYYCRIRSLEPFHCCESQRHTLGIFGLLVRFQNGRPPSLRSTQWLCTLGALQSLHHSCFSSRFLPSVKTVRKWTTCEWNCFKALQMNRAICNASPTISRHAHLCTTFNTHTSHHCTITQQKLLGSRDPLGNEHGAKTTHTHQTRNMSHNQLTLISATHTRPALAYTHHTTTHINRICVF